KNSLNGFRLGLDLLLRGGQAGRDPAGERVVSGLRKQIERMSDFTSELLIFAKGVSPKPVSMELRAFASKVADLAQDSANDLGVGLDVGRQGPEVVVRGAPSLLHVVISNLVGNALDAASSGNGLARAPRVGMEVGAAEGFGWVRVSDNGPGVAASIRPTLFEPFVSGKPSGVGIGLALSRKIARAHGGDLLLEPVEPGASFIL